MDEENEEELTSGINSKEKKEEISNKASQTKDRVKQINKMAKKVSKNYNKAAMKVGKAISKIAAKLGPALPWVALAILIIFVIVGICGFFATMPGLLTGKLKAIAQGIGDWWQSTYKTGADAVVNKDDIIETAEYIRSMGYDLIGYGFIPAKEIKDADKSSGNVYINEAGEYVDKDGNEVTNPGEYYDKYGIGYSVSGNEEGVEGSFETAGTIIDFLNYKGKIPDTAILRTYALADARLCSIRNYDGDSSLLSGMHDLFVENDEDWSKGLISLYKAEDFKATDKYTKFEKGYIKINSASKEMEIKVGWNTNSMKFKMDGWSGRYGLSLEFLLSLHLGTMAPELVSTMARSFDTEVQVYLDAVKADVTGAYKDENTEYITIDLMNEILADNASGSTTNINKKDAKILMKELGLKSKKEGDFKCTYSAENRIKYINGKEDNDNYNDIITDTDAGKMQNLITGKGNNISEEYPEIANANTWKDFLDNCDTTGHKRYNGDRTGCTDGCSGDDLFHIVDCINASVNYIKNNYGTWLNETEDNTVNNCIDSYKISLLKDLENYASFSEIKTINNTAKEFTICSFKSCSDSNLNEQKKVVLSLVVARTSTDHNYDFGVIVYEIPSEQEKVSDEVCSDTFGGDHEVEKVCSSCEKYIETMRTALNDINKDDFKTYNPYIARVVDSWFRDTYFVIPEDSVNDDKAINDVYNDKGKRNNYGDGADQIKLTGNDIEFVQVDDEYLKETDEYWTKYETNDDGKYILYELLQDGTLGTTQYIKDKDDEGREVYKNVSTGATELVEESNKKLVKKIFKEAGDTIIKGWKTNSAGNIWTVYTSSVIAGNGNWNELEVGTSTSDNIKKIAEFDGTDYKKYLYYRMENQNIIEQQEDARRGITNPTIKQMFKIRKYYIYDGTEEKAKEINDDWKKVIQDYGDSCLAAYGGNEYFKSKYENSPEKKKRAVEMALDDFYYYGAGPLSSDPRKKSLIGNITINKDTLNAFSILENTKTLDADYQYRDFKELIVELDYFDKEDLSDKPEKVFEWIIPDNKEKWPLRLIDKSEDYYGTLVHSDLAITKIKEKLGLEDSSEEGESPSAVSEEEKKITEVASATGYAEGADVVSPVTGEVISYGTYKRVNTDFIKYEHEGETEETLKEQSINVEEEVGYVQIKVLDEEAIETIKNNVSGSITVDYKKDNNTTSETVNKKDAWNGFYEEYKGVCDGYVVTIEGIDPVSFSDASSLKVAEIQAKTTPNLVDNEKEKQNQIIENAKVELDPAIEVGGKLYIREGTIIGTTTYSTTTEFENYSYIRMILRDEKLAVVENIEDYFESTYLGINRVSQEYVAQPDDLQILANLLHHEGCGEYFTNNVFGGDSEMGANASRVTGYVLINRAILNYGGHGTTITDQIRAPGQYATAYAVLNGISVDCEECLANAEFCLTYDCSSIVSPSSNTPMPRNVVGQSGWCQCSDGKFNCWWWIDTTGDGNHTEADAAGNPPYDTFYCINSAF